ncbi:hypothetical protein [Prauserella flavalba]|uniref:SCP2 domain-containing protein n=1 Tax=Prauserella flavalba TaxID=1477506 RepID=A0A318LEZ0_9PSEU|nr:hypothetical protein [Prauserella flavalba]PXY25477.1 hypothetical protein BA062_25220 [Prauserella flavalba]
MTSRPTFGTRELYDALAETLNGDPVWRKKAGKMTFGMTHVYTGELPLVVRMNFTEGVMSDVTVFDDVADVPSSEFVLSGDSKNWERMLMTGELSVNIALVSKQISVKGKMGPLMKNIPQFNYIIAKLIELEPRVLDDERA